MSDLLPSQQEGAEFLSARRGALLADEPRVGKTKPTIRACDYVLAEDVLWLTKGGARADHRNAWCETQMIDRQVTSIYSGSDRLPDGGTIVTSYDLAVGALFEDLRARKFHAVVFDESHRLKNLKAKRTQRAFGENAQRAGGLVERADFAWALTGTPYPNNYAEIYPVARALFPEALRTKRGIMSYPEFERRFCTVRDAGWGPKIVANRNAAELHERMAPYFLRRKFSEVFPDASVPVTERLFLDAQGNLDFLKDAEIVEIRKKYEPALRRARGNTELTDTILRQIESEVGPKLQRLTGEAKAAPLAQWAIEQIEDGVGKIVIFAWHRTVLDALAEALRRFNPITIDGRTTGRQKDVLKHRFQTDPKCKVALGQIVAAGEAIDLSAADTLVFAEASWSAGDNDQAWRRIVNMMKRSPVWVLFATLADSIDEDVQRANERKMRDITAVIDGE